MSDKPEDTTPEEGAPSEPTSESPTSEKAAAEQRPSSHTQSVEDISERFEKQRNEELEAALADDPDLRAAQARVDAQMEREREEQEKEEDQPTGEPEEELARQLDDGAASREQMHEPEAGESEIPEELRDDPLADYIVMDGGKPKMRLKVDGEERLLDLERARAIIQKNTAADDRLREASKWSKELQEREANVQRAEQALRDRTSQPATPPADTSGAEAPDLKKRSAEIVKSMFSGSEEEATEKLAGFAQEIFEHARKSTPHVDPEELGRQAVATARQELAAEAYRQDAKTGWEEFQQEYPDLMADQRLFGFADSLTDGIQEEHPEWSPGKVMMEAGKRTREWISSLKGENGEPEPEPEPADTGRVAAKESLRRVPRPGTARREVEPEERPQTPAEIVREMRAARNQPT